MNFSIKSGEDLLQLFVIITLLMFAIIMLVVVLNIFFVLKRINKGAEHAEEVEIEKRSFWNTINDLAPMEKEEELLMDHNYDGIRELDNHLPPWWLGLLYGGVVFAVIYLFNYHVWSWSPLQTEEYEIEMAEGKKEVDAYQAKLGESLDENSAKLETDAAVLANGQTIYTEKCVACHGAQGEGGVGPNLTDAYWLHGGDIKAVFSVIKHGVPEKGMISWKATLKPKEIQDVSNYILSIQGTNPANAKPPQGELAQKAEVEAK